MSHWRKVRELSSRLPPSPEEDETGAVARAQLLMLGARVATPPAEMAAYFHEGLELARRSGSDPARAGVLTAYGMYRLFTEGSVQDVLPDLEEAVRLIDRTDDVGFQLAARLNLSLALMQFEARRIYAEMGADGHAARITRQLGEVNFLPPSRR